MQTTTGNDERVIATCGAANRVPRALEAWIDRHV
jgi:hypothetical protein